MDLINQFSSGLFFIQAFVFFMLLFVLIKYAWKPILKSIEDRENSITDALDQAKLAREEMTQLKSDNEAILKEAKIERDNILKEARTIKDKIVAEAKTSAQEEAKQLIENAKATIQNEKMAAITELKNQIAVLSIDVAEKVLKEELKDKGKQQKLVEDLIKESNLN